MKQKSPRRNSRSSSVKQKNPATANQVRNSRKKSTSGESQKKMDNTSEIRPASDDQKDKENKEGQGFTESEQKTLMTIFERFLTGKGNWEASFDKFLQNHSHISETFVANNLLEEKAGFENFISLEIFAVLFVYRHLSLFEYAEDLEEFITRHKLQGDIIKTYFDKTITSLRSKFSQRQSSKKEAGRKSQEKKSARRSQTKNSEKKDQEAQSKGGARDSSQKKAATSSRTKNKAHSPKPESERPPRDEEEFLPKSREKSKKNRSQTKKEENAKEVSAESEAQPTEITVTITLNEEATIKAVEASPDDQGDSTQRVPGLSPSPSARPDERRQGTPSARGTPSNAVEREKASSAFKLIPVPRPEQAQALFTIQHSRLAEEGGLRPNEDVNFKSPIAVNESKTKITDHFESQKVSRDSKPETSNAGATSANLSAMSHIARHEENHSSSKKGFPSAAHLFPDEIHRKERSSTSPMKKFVKKESPEFLESLHKSKQVNTEGKPRSFFIYQLKTVPLPEGEATENIISATVVTTSEGTSARRIEDEVSAVSEFIMSNAKFVYEYNEGAESLPPWNSETSRIRQFLTKNSRNSPQQL